MIDDRVEVGDMLGDGQAMWIRLRIERTPCAALIPIDDDEIVFELAVEIAKQGPSAPPGPPCSQSITGAFLLAPRVSKYSFVPSKVRCSERLIETVAVAMAHNRRTTHPARRAHKMSDSVSGVR